MFLLQRINRIGLHLFHGRIFLIVVLVAAIFAFVPMFIGQGLLVWQSKQTQLGQTVLRSQYFSGLTSYEVVRQYETWAQKDKTCGIFTPVE